MNGDQHIELNDVNITGATSFGPNSTASAGSVHTSPTAELDELRSRVSELRRDLDDRAGTTQELKEAREHTRELDEELASEQPRPGPVKKRWKRLEPLLKTLTAASSLATISELVRNLS